MLRYVLGALAGVALFPCPALAGVLMPQTGSAPLVVRKQLLSVDVRDQVARVTVDEVFENLTDQPLEGTYFLTMPDGAAISGFATWVDGQRVESRVEEKSAAKEDYDAAKKRGQKPALLEQTDGHTFTTHVDGIPAHGTKRVEASYALILPYDGGLVTVRLPLAVSGRSGAEKVSDQRITAEIRDQKPITELKALSHPAVVSRAAKNAFHVEYAAKDAATQSDFVLTYRTESSALGLTFVPFKPKAGEKDGYFLLLASPQELTSSADIVQKDVVFVFDTSGSMSGEKIDQAQQALKRCLSNLNREDRFGIVAFSDSTNPFRNKLLLASEENVRAGMEFADGLRAGGGTNISGGLLRGMEMFEDGDRPRVIVFMTDGIPSAGISDAPSLAAAIREKNAGRARLFSFGVGSDVNRTLLEQLAKENRGSQDFVERGMSIDGVVGAFYAKIARPVLSDLSFDFGDVTTAMQYPDVLPDLYKGSQLALVGRYRGSGKTHAALVGTLNGKKVRIPFEAEFPAEEEQNTFVARLWAQRRIDFLLSQNRLQGEREEARAEIVALATQYQIVTPYTSMVAVRTEEQKVAAVFPARVKPGDPVVWIRAPREAKEVRVHVFGEVKRARFDDEKQAWMARFLVPAGTPDGTYPITAEIVHEDGHREELALSIGVDTAAPALAARISPVSAGEAFTIRAAAVVSPEEIGRALLSRDDRYTAVKSLFDVRRVTARLWDGREVPLTLDEGGLGFIASAETNGSMQKGRYEVVLTAQDFAGNTARTVTMLEVR